jgi:hypothetical protein
MCSVLLSGTPHTIKYAARKRRVPAVLGPAARAPLAHGVRTPARAPPATAPVFGQAQRPARQSADALPLGCSVATGTEAYATSLQPSFRAKGRQEFTHRQSDWKKPQERETIDRKKGALKVEKCIAYTVTLSICEYYHLGAFRGGMTAAQVTPFTAMASRGRARDTGSARLPQVAPSRRRAREGSPPSVAQDDARARTSRRCCARRMVGQTTS